MNRKINPMLSLLLTVFLVVSFIPLGAVTVLAGGDDPEDPNVCYLNLYLDPDDEMPVSSSEQIKGQPPVRVADPGREDQTFMGWYIDKEFTTPFDFSKPLYEDADLYAWFVDNEDILNVYVFLSPDDEYPVAGWMAVKGKPLERPFDLEKAEGKIFCGWYSDRELIEEFDFSKPVDNDVTLFARFGGDEDCYGVFVYLTPDDEDWTTGYDVPKGSPISKPAEPAREGYEFLGWFTDRELTQPADFTTPRSEDVNLYAGWKLILPDNPFVDVKSDDYFSDAVLWALNKDITKGTDDTHFSPDATCTRGQVVTFLWRAAGSPEPESAVNPFTDVNTDDYYCKAVLWAVKEGITKGTSDTAFGPNQSCTRGQVATFLHRAEGTPDAGSIENPFTDVNRDQYYYDAVLWAVMRDITQGTGANTFSPNVPCTRGQIVTFLFRDMA